MELRNPAGFGLRVDFEFRQDRWMHRIHCLGVGRTHRLLLASVEGTSSDRWPPSPPLQELVIERRSDPSAEGNAPQAALTRRVALLLGRAGSGHWSASLELFNDPVRLVVDVACRSAERPEFIGSSFLSSNAPFRRADVRDQLELWRDTATIVALTLSAGKLHLSPANPLEVRICPEPLDPPATWRWCYSIAIKVAAA